MPTRTTNQLHFEDLAPDRFEEMISSIVFRMRKWQSINHFGKNGSDSGVDIRGVEELESGKVRIFNFQCKRYKKINQSQIKHILDDYVKQNEDASSTNYILVVACAVSRKNVEKFEQYAKSKGILIASIWDKTYIESLLYYSFPDLLFVYFNLDLSSDRHKRVEAVKKNIELKHRMRVDFLRTNLTPEDRQTIGKEPRRKFKHSTVLIRSIDDIYYPEVNDFSRFFKTEPFDFYYNGLMLHIIPYRERVKVKLRGSDEVQELELTIVGCIPYDNIIDYDIEGDEYYREPHIFCDFVNTYNPFEKIEYYLAAEYGYRHIRSDEIITD